MSDKGCQNPLFWFIKLHRLYDYPLSQFESHSVEVYSIQNYVMKLVSDLRQVGGFLLFPPPIKLTATI